MASLALLHGNSRRRKTMRHEHGRLAAAALALGVLFAESASGQKSSSCDVQQQLTTPVAADTALRLMACPLAPMFEAGQPVRVFLLLQNVGEEALRVRATFAHRITIFVRVAGPSGEDIPTMSHDPFHMPRINDIELPTGGSTGMIIAIGCALIDYSRDTYSGCGPTYDFSRPGTYTVHVSCFVDCHDPPCSDWFPWTGRVDADPFTLVIAAK